MNDQSAFITRGTTAYARVITKHPGRVLAVLLVLGVISGYLTSTLTIESDQLSLISQDLPETWSAALATCSSPCAPMTRRR